MLKFLRKKGVMKKLLWVVAVVIIISFGFLGTAYLITDTPQARVAGEIFGRKIKTDEFFDVYRHTEVFSKIRYGDKYFEIRPYLNLDAETWDRMILLHEAKKQRINVSDEEVAQRIASYEFFKRDGQFDPLLYNSILQSSFINMQPREFEEAIRDDLRIAKMFENVIETEPISEARLFEEFKKQNEKVQVSYALIPHEKYLKDASYNEAEAKKYYRNHKETFRVPPSIQAEYIRVELPEEDSEEKKDQAREHAIGIYQELLEDPDFQEVAEKYGVAIRETEFFTAENPPLKLGWSLDFLNELFQTPLSQLMEPHETENAVDIVRIKAQKEPHIPPFSQIQEKVRKALLKEKAKKIAEEKAEDYRQKIAEQYQSSPEADFAEIVKSHNLQLYQTPMFNRGLYLPHIGFSKEFEQAAFALTEDNPLSGVVETAKGFAILHLDDTVPAEKGEEFEKTKEEIRNRLLEEQRNEQISRYISSLRIKANLVDNIADLRRSNRAN